MSPPGLLAVLPHCCLYPVALNRALFYLLDLTARTFRHIVNTGNACYMEEQQGCQAHELVLKTQYLPGTRSLLPLSAQDLSPESSTMCVGTEWKLEELGAG